MSAADRFTAAVQASRRRADAFTSLVRRVETADEFWAGMRTALSGACPYRGLLRAMRRVGPSFAPARHVRVTTDQAGRTYWSIAIGPDAGLALVVLLDGDRSEARAALVVAAADFEAWLRTNDAIARAEDNWGWHHVAKLAEG